MSFFKSMGRGTDDCAGDCPDMMRCCPDLPVLKITISGTTPCSCFGGPSISGKITSASLDGVYMLAKVPGGWGISGIGSWTSEYYGSGDCSGAVTSTGSGTFSIFVNCGGPPSVLFANVTADGAGSAGGGSDSYFFNSATGDPLPLPVTMASAGACGGIYPGAGGTAIVEEP